MHGKPLANLLHPCPEGADCLEHSCPCWAGTTGLQTIAGRLPAAALPLMLLVHHALSFFLQVIAVKAPGFGERKSSYLEDIAILTGAQVVKEELGLQLDKVSRCTRL